MRVLGGAPKSKDRPPMVYQPLVVGDSKKISRMKNKPHNHVEPQDGKGNFVVCCLLHSHPHCDCGSSHGNPAIPGHVLLFVFLLCHQAINNTTIPPGTVYIACTSESRSLYDQRGGPNGLREESPRPSPLRRAPQIGDKSGTAIGHFDSVSVDRHWHRGS